MYKQFSSVYIRQLLNLKCKLLLTVWNIYHYYQPLKMYSIHNFQNILNYQSKTALLEDALLSLCLFSNDFEDHYFSLKFTETFHVNIIWLTVVFCFLINMKLFKLMSPLDETRYCISYFFVYLTTKKNVKKVWSKHLVYEKTFWLSSYDPRIQFIFLSRKIIIKCLNSFFEVINYFFGSIVKITFTKKAV